jgi:nanoRNase/pAp phosphatase (c-di-AMP/oligoRNAs hydrolase)
MHATSAAEPPWTRTRHSERLLRTLEPFERVAIFSHVNPDPDALASMLGLRALVEARLPGRPVVLTLDGMIARAENQAMVRQLRIPLVPVAAAPRGENTAVVMVDTQPSNTGRLGAEPMRPHVVLDHHETPGTLDGVLFRDIRPDLGATTTLVTGYLVEQAVPIDATLATALIYGIDSEISGYPREAGPADDGALVWLFPRADKDLLARIRNPRLPLSYFATFHHALANAFLYRDVIVSWCGPVPQPDIIAELADFFIRFDQVSWVVSIGLYDDMLKLSARCDHIGGRCGETLRTIVNGLGSAGGHDRRAGGAIPVADRTPERIDELLRTVRHRFLSRLGIDEEQGRRLLETCPLIPAP